MVLNQTTIDTLNYTQDLTTEYNIKFWILALLFIYCVGSLWLSYRWKTEYNWQNFLKYFLLKIPSAILLFLFPFFTIYLLRTVSWETLYMLMIPLYSYYLIVILIGGKLGFFEWAWTLLGFKKMDKLEAKLK